MMRSPNQHHLDILRLRWLVWLCFVSLLILATPVWSADVLKAPQKSKGASSNFWSLKPLVRPMVPAGEANAIDAFVRDTLHSKGLKPSPQADKRTLIRRVYFDLIGLPPTPEEVEAFIKDHAHDAYAKIVDRLLESPRYGERWARHWLDVVHYGETHGYDKDQPRPNAWPYRDYVIRAFNSDKPYARFVREQVAGDALFPGTQDGIEALGFIAAGPWDFIGHAEVPETKIDGKIARHLDRDDMVANTINTFCSATVHCAQCHNHKFDPISQEDYYSLQAVFAAVDRADKVYDLDPEVARTRAALETQKREWLSRRDVLNALVKEQGGAALAALDERISTATKSTASGLKDEYGYHSAISAEQVASKWVQVDLGESVPLEKVVLAPCHDDFNGIGDGFGFPLRYTVQLSDDVEFKQGTITVVDLSENDVARPGVALQTHACAGQRGRYLRVTATRLAPRMGDFIFALAELQAFDHAGVNRALSAKVTAADSIEAGPRWRMSNLTDGIYPSQKAVSPVELAALKEQRETLLRQSVAAPVLTEIAQLETSLTNNASDMAKLPAASRVYAGTIHKGSGAFAGTGGAGGKPRPIHMLARGDVRKPGREVRAGSLSCVTGLASRFDVSENSPESDRRAALANWLVDSRNPLTWRSVVNRVWQYHFGRAIVDSPNDFGRMGQLPSHPELLDWLAVTFRDDFQGSFKRLHRLIVTSKTYCQRSDVMDTKAVELDSENYLLWRMNRRKLEAEAVRDTLLTLAGRMDLKMGGPSFQDFVVTHPEHSPHYEYQLADMDNPALHRRSVYRFIVRSQQQPWMAALDCADPSMLVEKRNQTLTPLQALAQLNNQLSVVMAAHFSERVMADAGSEPTRQIQHAFQLAFQRPTRSTELRPLVRYAETYGLANACRLIMNLNEFAFID